MLHYLWTLMFVMYYLFIKHFKNAELLAEFLYRPLKSIKTCFRLEFPFHHKMSFLLLMFLSLVALRNDFKKVVRCQFIHTSAYSFFSSCWKHLGKYELFLKMAYLKIKHINVFALPYFMLCCNGINIVFFSLFNITVKYVIFLAMVNIVKKLVCS